MCSRTRELMYKANLLKYFTYQHTAVCFLAKSLVIYDVFEISISCFRVRNHLIKYSPRFETQFDRE